MVPTISDDAGFDSDQLARKFRERLIIPHEKKVLITNLYQSREAEDITSGINCEGYGRLHRYSRPSEQWIEVPVPAQPAAWRLGKGVEELQTAQLFQNAGCDHRCWYCFVDFALLAADPKRGKYLSAEDMLDLYLKEEQRSNVITLTGGQPDLTPEWTLWMMQALTKYGLQDDIYLWQDDNLSCGYTWTYLTDADREYMKAYRNHGRICCLKSLTSEGFHETTGAHPSLFDRQFDLLRRIVDWGIDVYVYVTFTTSTLDGARISMRRFVDRLQEEVHPNIPLRVSPLEVKLYTPTNGRMTEPRRQAIENQYHFLELWLEELERRFSSSERSLPQYLVTLR
jgi:uncharacterized Fe-S cluster-containing radical SAM superfamily protein